MSNAVAPAQAEHFRPLRVFLIGWAGSPGMMVQGIIRGLHAQELQLEITHMPAPPTEAAAIAGADIIFLQGFANPSEFLPLRELLASLPDHPQVLACGVPCAPELLELATAPSPGIAARLRAALSSLDPAALRHAILVAAHGVDSQRPDPGALQASQPAGRFKLGTEESDPAQPTADIGLMLSPFQVSNKDLAVAQAVAHALQNHGLRPVAWAGDPTTVAKGKMPAPKVAAWVNLSGFTLAGTHANPRVPEGVEYLGNQRTPLFTPAILQRTTAAEWAQMPGLTPGQLSMNIAVPEFEGALFPWVVALRGPAGLEPYKPGIKLLAQRVARTIHLQQTPVAQRKISITLFGHDSDGTIGTAANLDVFESLWRFLAELAATGYSVAVPDSPQALIDALLGAGNTQRAQCSVADRWPVADYIAALNSAVADFPDDAIADQIRRIDPLWGRVPGAVDTDGRHMEIRGAYFGNVFVGIQPDFGDYADPLNVLMAPEAAPSHSFAAYYAWLSQKFAHDAMLHWGTHGAQEFMPGRATGMVADDWPQLLTGGVPHFYLYAMSNPAEGTIAKRRSAAGLVSYLTPQLVEAGLYGALAAVGEECQRLLTGELIDAAACAELVELVADANLEEFPVPDSTAPDAAWGSWVAEVSKAVEAVRATPVPEGLHIVGQAIAPEDTHDMLQLALSYPAGEHAPLTESWDPAEQEALLEVVCRGGELQELPANLVQREETIAWYRHLRHIWGNVTNNGEVAGLLTALDGLYVPPVAGGEPASHPDALPTGRNIHGEDPAVLPTATAVRRGAATAEALLEAEVAAQGSYPESIAMVIWGLDNMKTRGEGIAQAFRLIGAEPQVDSRGRVSQYRIIPLEELGRPRIDVVLTLSGVGRDLLSGPVQLLDDAIREVASLDEPANQNFLRLHAQANAAQGIAAEDAITRVFAMAPGNYGTGVNKMVQAGTWEDPQELAEVYLHRMSFAWGKNASGKPAPDALRAALTPVRTTFQNVDSTEISLAGVDHYFEFLGGVSAVVESLTGEKPQARVSQAWQHETNVSTLEDAMRLESRSRLLNPKWYEAQLAHGYQGVAMVRTRFENTFGMQATTQAVDNWVFDEAAQTFILDDALRERMMEENPAAVFSMTQRLLEAAERGLWDADPDMLEDLEDLADDIDAHLEGMA